MALKKSMTIEIRLISFFGCLEANVCVHRWKDVLFLADLLVKHKTYWKDYLEVLEVEYNQRQLLWGEVEDDERTGLLGMESLSFSIPCLACRFQSVLETKLYDVLIDDPMKKKWTMDCGSRIRRKMKNVT
jgi:hypothetical protein